MEPKTLSLLSVGACCLAVLMAVVFPGNDSDIACVGAFGLLTFSICTSIGREWAEGAFD